MLRFCLAFAATAAFAQETVVVNYNDRAALEGAFAANPGQIACVILEG